MGDQGRRQADGGSIQRRDEDFGMSIEGVRDIEVVSHEGA